MRGILMVMVVAVLLAPVSVGQDHEHLTSTEVVIAHDVTPGGRTYVGNLNHFVVLYLGNDTKPDFHQQNQVRVLLNGAVIFETTPDSGHDYDGVYGFDVVFGRPGHYRVEAWQQDKLQATFEGDVVPADLTLKGDPKLVLATQGTGLPGELAQPGQFAFSYAAQRENGSLFNHGDAVFEVYQDPVTAAGPSGAQVLQSSALVLRAKTHTHNDLQQVSASFPAGGYTGRASTYLSYPMGSNEFQPVSEFVSFASLSSPLTQGAIPPSVAGLGLNVVVQGIAGEQFELLGTYDPYNVVGPGTLQHLTVIVIDPLTKQPRQHVNFEAKLVAPGNRMVFESATLHEYDGILEIDTVQREPGLYKLSVAATSGDWSGTIDLPYTVAGGLGSIGAGPQLVTLTKARDLQVGQPVGFSFRVADLAGNPFQHGEVDIVIERLNPDTPGATFGVPVLRAKLHTHAGGNFPFTYSFPETGNYVIRASPYGLSATATPVFWGGVVGGPLTFPIAVGPETVVEPQEEPTVDSARDTPALPLVMLLIAFLALAAIRRR